MCYISSLLLSRQIFVSFTNICCRQVGANVKEIIRNSHAHQRIIQVYQKISLINLMRRTANNPEKYGYCNGYLSCVHISYPTPKPAHRLIRSCTLYKWYSIYSSSTMPSKTSTSKNRTSPSAPAGPQCPPQAAPQT